MPTDQPTDGPTDQPTDGPTDDEMAAILAAVEALWPRPVVAGAPDEDPPRWRFSGRWWTKPVPARRGRPN